MHTKITEHTTFEQLDAQLAEYDLTVDKVKIDQDGYNVALVDRTGRTIALGMAPSFYAALEDAFQDVDGLAVLDNRQGAVA